MSCPEYLRLRQRYESALRRWADVELSSKGRNFFDAPVHLTAEIKEGALKERNATRNRMCFHEENCPVCELTGSSR